METMVKHYSAELLPVAAQLTARLVSSVLRKHFLFSHAVGSVSYINAS